MSGFSRNDRETAAIRASPNQHRRKCWSWDEELLHANRGNRANEWMELLRGDWVRRFYSDDKVIILKFIRIVFYRNLDGISGKKKYSKNIYSYSLYSRFKNNVFDLYKALPFSCDASNQAKSFFRKISFVKSSRKTFETIETLDSKAFNSYLSGNRGSSSFFQSYTLITREKRKTENNFREEYAKQ